MLRAVAILAIILLATSADLATQAAAQTRTAAALRLTVKLDCGTLDGAGRVLIIIDGAAADPVAIECKRQPI
jgi:hypothetical protein